MHTSVLLLRGINVGGKNKLPMKELAEQLKLLKLENIQTYIQSGNVVFQTRRKPASKLNSRIAQAIEQSHGFLPSALVFSRAQLKAAMDCNPWPQATSEPKTLHLFFLTSPAGDADVKAIKACQTSSEKIEITDDVVYLHAPDGFGRSKLAANLEKHLRVSTTARNWRTVEKLSEMCENLS